MILRTNHICEIMLFLVEFQVQFFCQIHFGQGQVVYLWSPFLNGLCYKVALELDRKIIRSRLRISHNLIRFIAILSCYGLFCLFLDSKIIQDTSLANLMPICLWGKKTAHNSCSFYHKFLTN